ncbi:MAG: hypothetical protein QXL91_00205 [Candidatus Bathyarchaeia archaeon]|nr:hypothetical protein [Candidatus Bathyarchaeota archaeon]
MRLFWRFSINKRAVSPVLSNLLLMVVAVAAMSIAATATYVVTTNLRETMGERFVVEDVWFNNATGVSCISIYIRNTGKSAITISAVYVNNTPAYGFAKLDLGLGDHGWLNITYPWEKGHVYYINVVTSRGNHIEGYYKAP